MKYRYKVINIFLDSQEADFKIILHEGSRATLLTLSSSLCFNICSWHSRQSNHFCCQKWKWNSKGKQQQQYSWQDCNLRGHQFPLSGQKWFIPLLPPRSPSYSISKTFQALLFYCYFFAMQVVLYTMKKKKYLCLIFPIRLQIRICTYK